MARRMSRTSSGWLFIIRKPGRDNKFLEIIDNATDVHVFKMCEKPSLTLSLADSLITTFDFLSPTTVVCGFKNGFVAEFDLTDPEVPSFYDQVHDSYILSVSTAYSDFEDTVVSTVAVDGYFYIFNPKDIATTKTTVSRFREVIWFQLFIVLKSTRIFTQMVQVP